MDLEGKNYCDDDREKENAKIETINGMHNTYYVQCTTLKSLNENDAKRENVKKHITHTRTQKRASAEAETTHSIKYSDHVHSFLLFH